MLMKVNRWREIWTHSGTHYENTRTGFLYWKGEIVRSLRQRLFVCLARFVPPPLQRTTWVCSGGGGRPKYLQKGKGPSLEPDVLKCKVAPTQRYNYTDRPSLVGEVSVNFCGCRVVSAADLYDRILGFLDRSRYFFFQVLNCTHETEWTPIFSSETSVVIQKKKLIWGTNICICIPYYSCSQFWFFCKKSSCGQLVGVPLAGPTHRPYYTSRWYSNMRYISMVEVMRISRLPLCSSHTFFFVACREERLC
jgi:hypothetical protein